MFPIKHNTLGAGAAAAVVVAVAAITLAACGGKDSGSVTLGVPPTTTPTSVPVVVSPGVTTTTTPEPASDDLTGFQTDAFRKEHPATVPPVPQVVAVRTAHHLGYDRLVFDFAGALPSAESVRYTTAVVADGSGAPVAVAGKAYLLITFEEAQAHTSTGAATIAARSQPGGLSVVKEIVVAGDYEGYVTIALGLSDRVPFRVLELSNPGRVVVDVRSAA